MKKENSLRRYCDLFVIKNVLIMHRPPGSLKSNLRDEESGIDEMGQYKDGVEDSTGSWRGLGTFIVLPVVN